MATSTTTGGQLDDAAYEVRQRVPRATTTATANPSDWARDRGQSSARIWSAYTCHRFATTECDVFDADGQQAGRGSRRPDMVDPHPREALTLLRSSASATVRRRRRRPREPQRHCSRVAKPGPARHWTGTATEIYAMPISTPYGRANATHLGAATRATAAQAGNAALRRRRREPARSPTSGRLFQRLKPAPPRGCAVRTGSVSVSVQRHPPSTTTATES